MSLAADKIILTCAITGSIHTPSMSPYLPVTPDEIADEAIAAAVAGASVVHLHARDPETGRPSQEPDLFRAFLPRIAAASDVIVNLTTGGSPQMSVAERLRPAAELKPEIASLNMGSMNFGLFPMLNRPRDYKYDWEVPYLENSRASIFRNTFADIESILVQCGEDGARFEIECYDTSHLYTTAHFLDKGLLKPPLLIQTVFGILGGIGAHPQDIMHMRATANRLFGSDYYWSVLGTGRSQMRVATIAAAMGGHVRVGLEDSLWDGPGQLARSNAAQVSRIRRILAELSLEIASPEEVRAALSLKGKANVGF